MDERFYDYFNIEKRKQEDQESDAEDEIDVNKENEFSKLNIGDKPLTKEKTELPESLNQEKEEQEIISNQVNADEENESDIEDPSTEEKIEPPESLAQEKEEQEEGQKEQ